MFDILHHDIEAYKKDKIANICWLQEKAKEFQKSI